MFQYATAITHVYPHIDAFTQTRINPHVTYAQAHSNTCRQYIAIEAPHIAEYVVQHRAGTRGNTVDGVVAAHDSFGTWYRRGA